MNYRDTQEPVPKTITPSEAERKYLDVLAQIELRRLELKRIDARHTTIVAEIKNLEGVAEQSRRAAVGS